MIALAADAPIIPPALTIRAIAPGGNITSVVQATEILGWPHEPTTNEVNDVADLALLTAARTSPRPAHLTVACYFGASMGRSHCGVVVKQHGRRPLRYRMNLKVWEDGGYRFSLASNPAVK